MTTKVPMGSNLIFHIFKLAVDDSGSINDGFSFGIISHLPETVHVTVQYTRTKSYISHGKLYSSAVGKA